MPHSNNWTSSFWAGLDLYFIMNLGFFISNSDKPNSNFRGPRVFFYPLNPITEKTAHIFSESLNVSTNKNASNHSKIYSSSPDCNHTHVSAAPIQSFAQWFADCTIIRFALHLTYNLENGFGVLLLPSYCDSNSRGNILYSGVVYIREHYQLSEARILIPILIFSFNPLFCYPFYHGGHPL